MKTKGFIIKRCAGAAITAGYALLCCSISFAESAGHGGHHTPSFADIIPYWINFALYVALMTVLLKKPISNAWKARTGNIETQVNKGRVEREAAEKLFSVATARRAGLPAEIQSLAEQIAQEGKVEAAELLKDARERAQRTRQQGKDMVVAEAKALEVSLKRNLAEEVIRKATESLKRQMNVNSDAKLRAAAVKDITSLVH